MGILTSRNFSWRLVNHNVVLLTDVRVSPTDSDDFRPAGMEALEILHNQLQLLVSIVTGGCGGDGDCVVVEE